MITSVREQRCEGITGIRANVDDETKQCKCWAVLRINEIPYCLQHGYKEFCAIAEVESAPTVGPTSRPLEAGPK
jgi:hypothetical protein